jgi:hypothetical protein
MNVGNFNEILDLMAYSGFRLTQMEAALIENSLIILQSSNKLHEIFFFGKIDTSGDQSYYIAFGYRRDVLKDRRFFYSLNGFEWVMLPEVKFELMEVARTAVNFFRGDPAHMEKVEMVTRIE